MRCADTDLPAKLGCIRPEIHNRTTLIHVDTGTHIGIAIPEDLLIGAVKYVLPKCTFRLGIMLFLTVVVSKLRHSHINELTLFLKLTIVSHTVLIGLAEKLIRCLPASHLIKPAGAYKHHVVAVSVIVFR